MVPWSTLIAQVPVPDVLTAPPPTATPTWWLWLVPLIAFTAYVSFRLYCRTEQRYEIYSLTSEGNDYKDCTDLEWGTNYVSFTCEGRRHTLFAPLETIQIS